jgi:hypothetical protein
MSLLPEVGAAGALHRVRSLRYKKEGPDDRSGLFTHAPENWRINGVRLTELASPPSHQYWGHVVGSCWRLYPRKSGRGLEEIVSLINEPGLHIIKVRRMAHGRHASSYECPGASPIAA